MGKRDSKSIRLRENNGSDQHFTEAHRSEVLANLTAPMRALCNLLARGEISDLMARSPRQCRPVTGSNRRLSPGEVDQMVEDYRSGVGSIYDLAAIYGVHRNTISMHLKARGVHLRRQPLNDREINRSRELHEDGLSLNAIGRVLGRDPKTIKSAISVQS